MVKEYISRDEMIEQTKARVVLGAPKFNTGLEVAIEVATSIPAAGVITWTELMVRMVDKFKSRLAAGYAPTWNDAMKVVEELRPNGGQREC